MIFERRKYLDELIAGRGNGLVKIITGVRRCERQIIYWYRDEILLRRHRHGVLTVGLLDFLTDKDLLELG